MAELYFVERNEDGTIKGYFTEDYFTAMSINSKKDIHNISDGSSLDDVEELLKKEKINYKKYKGINIIEIQNISTFLEKVSEERIIHAGHERITLSN